MSLINDILQLLNANHKTQSDLCEHLGINTSTMTNWKNRGTEPPAKYIVPICEFFGVSPYYLLTGKEAPQNTEQLTATERQFIGKFNRLEPIDQGRMLERMDMIYESYSDNNQPAAAQELPDAFNEPAEPTAAIFGQKKHLA